jgi:hypothetical protein
MALHPGEQGYCEKHGAFDEYCCDCVDTVRIIYESKVKPLPALVKEKREPSKPPAMTVTEMREHLSQVDMVKQYLREAVEAYMAFINKEEFLYHLLGKSPEGLWTMVHNTITRLSSSEARISDAEVESLMNYAKIGKE